MKPKRVSRLPNKGDTGKLTTHHAEVNVVWWRLRTSNPSKGGNVLGEFDSHTPPPFLQGIPNLYTEAIICFESVTQAIMAEQALVGGKFSVRVMPMPSAIRGGCGFCLRFAPDDLERAAAFLLGLEIAVDEAYLREEAQGAPYHKIPLLFK